eukprot:160160_1
MEQFNNEYTKSSIKLQSNYCNQNFVEYYSRKVNWKFSIQHLLSLMIYCNYTELQFELSKTYRENGGDNHTNFYFWGKYLKISVHRFNHENSKVSTFYHGIGKQLLWPQYVSRYRTGVFVNCPLSTTSVPEVAFSFSNSDTGMVFTFKHVSKQHLSVAWLSDYPSENEFLFVQTTHRMIINDIIEINSGYHYKILLYAMQHLDTICFGGENIQDIADSQTSMIIDMIIQHRLSSDLSSIYESWHHLSEYGKQTIDVYFKNKKRIYLQPLHIRQKNLFLSHLFFHYKSQKFPCIKISKILSLGCNLEKMCLIGINVSASLLDNILKHFRDYPSLRLQIIEFWYAPSDHNWTLDILSKYKQPFNEINYHIGFHCNQSSYTSSNVYYITKNAYNHPSNDTSSIHQNHIIRKLNELAFKPSSTDESWTLKF